MPITRKQCDDYGHAMKHYDDTKHCEGCSSFHKCVMTSQLRVLMGIHQGVGILLISAGLAQGVDENGRPIAGRKIVAPPGPLPAPGPLAPV